MIVRAIHLVRILTLPGLIIVDQPHLAEVTPLIRQRQLVPHPGGGETPAVNGVTQHTAIVRPARRVVLEVELFQRQQVRAVEAEVQGAQGTIHQLRDVPVVVHLVVDAFRMQAGDVQRLLSNAVVRIQIEVCVPGDERAELIVDGRAVYTAIENVLRTQRYDGLIEIARFGTQRGVSTRP